MKRYYVRETGYDLSRRLAMGELLNEDGSVYDPVMPRSQPLDSEDLHQSIPTIVSDGYDIKIEKVNDDRSYAEFARATLVFWQQRSDFKDVVASVSLQVQELEKLGDKIAQKIKDYRTS